jgi:hypothetical protein
MTDTDYLDRARREIAIEDSAAVEQRIADRANALRAADERAASHQAQCKRYGLDPATASERQKADCWMAEQVAFKEYVVDKHGNLAPHILNDDVPLADTAPQSMRDRVAAAKQTVRADFEAQYVPQALAPGEIDSATQARGHNTMAA